MKNYSSVNGEIKLILMATGDQEMNHPIIPAFWDALRGLGKVLLVYCNTHVSRENLFESLRSAGYEEVVKIDGGSPIPLDGERCVLFLAEGDDSNATGAKGGGLELVKTGVEVWVRDNLMLMYNNGDPDDPVQIFHGAPPWGEVVTDILVEGEGKPLDIMLEGGDILFVQDDVIIGPGRFWNENEAIKMTKRLQDVGLHQNPNMVTLITTNEQLYHIDLYITPTGIVENTKSVLKKVVVVGWPLPLAYTHYKEVGILQRQVQAHIEILKARGYKVKKIPLPILYRGHDVLVYSYNNAIVENFGAVRRVWMSRLSFGEQDPVHKIKLSIYEHEIEKVWNALGFEVRYITADFSRHLSSKGLLHCITTEMRD